MRRIVLSTLVAGVVLLGAGVPAAVATTAATTVTCNIAATAYVQPGLLITARQNTLSVGLNGHPVGTLTSCTTSNPTVSGLTGTFQAQGSGVVGCTTGTASGKAKVIWSLNGVVKGSSVLTIAIDVGAGTLTGAVTSGILTGESLSANVSVTPNEGNCVTNAVNSGTLSGTATIS